MSAQSIRTEDGFVEGSGRISGGGGSSGCCCRCCCPVTHRIRTFHPTPSFIISILKHIFILRIFNYTNKFKSEPFHDHICSGYLGSNSCLCDRPSHCPREGFWRNTRLDSSCVGCCSAILSCSSRNRETFSLCSWKKNLNRWVHRLINLASGIVYELVNFGERQSFVAALLDSHGDQSHVRVGRLQVRIVIRLLLLLLLLLLLRLLLWRQFRLDFGPNRRMQLLERRWRRKFLVMIDRSLHQCLMFAVLLLVMDSRWVRRQILVMMTLDRRLLQVVLLVSDMLIIYETFSRWN